MAASGNWHGFLWTRTELSQKSPEVEPQGFPVLSSETQQTGLALCCFFWGLFKWAWAGWLLWSGDPVHLSDSRFFRAALVAGPSAHSVLWNAMIHPLQNMTLKGAVWYQGELTLSPLYQLAFAVWPRAPRSWWRQSPVTLYFPLALASLA